MTASSGVWKVRGWAVARIDMDDFGDENADDKDENDEEDGKERESDVSHVQRSTTT